MRNAAIIIACISLAVACHNKSSSQSASDGNAPTCSDDTTCAQPLPYCDQSIGECVQCLSDTNCGDNRSCNADSHKCVQCATDSQCGGQLPYCSTDGSCVQCVADGNCPTGDGCDQTNNRCFVKCTTSAMCHDPTALCDTATSHCVECLANTDCKIALAPVCDTMDGQCVECTANTDCPAQRPKCDTRDVCVQCIVDTDCTTAGQTCQNGVCRN